MNFIKGFLFSISVLLLALSCNNSSVTQNDVNSSQMNSRAVSNDYIILYRHDDYKGTSQKVYFREGVINIDGALDDQVSSIKLFLTRSRKLNCYDGKNGSGIEESVLDDIPSLSRFGMNDMLSSLKFVGAKSTGLTDIYYYTFYEDKNFKGKSYSIRTRTGEVKVPDYLKGKVSSLKASNNPDDHLTKVWLEGVDEKGRNRHMNLRLGDYPDLSLFGFDNILESIWAGCPRYQPKVIVYDEPNYKGSYREIFLGVNPSDIELDVIKLWEFGFNDKAQSIRTLNCRVQLYQHGDATGDQRGVTGNVTLGTYNLNNQLSLIKILYEIDEDGNHIYK